MAMRRVVPTRSRAGTLAVGVLATLGVLTGLCGFVPSIALANDLSTDSCTAQDVTLGNGFILNEPCVCSPGGTFAAMVQFTVTNNASASRYCISDGSKTSATSHDFTVTVTKDTTYTLTVTDSLGCTRTATASLKAPPLAAPTFAAGTPDCAGKTTLTASPSGLASYTWFDGTTRIGTGNPLTVTLAPGDHSIAVQVTSSAGCSNTSGPTAVTVNQPVSTSLDTGSAPDCKGNLTFTASATGGTGSYTYAWAIDGTPVSGVSGPTLNYPPAVDCNAHVVTVTATDSANCVSGNTAQRTGTQVVTTTVK